MLARRRPGAADAHAGGSPSGPRQPARRAVLRRRGDACCSSRCSRCRRWPIFGMGHVGTELARILARHDIELHLVDSRSRHVEPRAAGGDHRGRRGPGAPPPRGGAGAGARRAAGRQPRAADDPRPRRGRRALRRRAALRAPGLDRADRVLGEVAPVREEARRGGARRGGAGPHHHPDRAAGDHRQGAGDHRGERGRRPAAAVRTRRPPADVAERGRHEHRSETRAAEATR